MDGDLGAQFSIPLDVHILMFMICYMSYSYTSITTMRRRFADGRDGMLDVEAA